MVILREWKVKLEMRVESGTEAQKELFQGHSFDCAVFRVCKKSLKVLGRAKVRKRTKRA